MMMANQDADIVAYLLGELPDSQRDALEQRFLRDEELRELMRAVEDELIDDYVQDELEPHQRERFEAEYLSHPQRRQKVELARTLSRAWDQPPATEAQLSRVTAVPRFVLAAAAVLAIATVGWLIAPQLANRAGTEDGAPQAGGSAQPAQPPAATQPPPPTSPESAPPRALAIATFTLSPGLTRDAAAATTLPVPSSTDLVRLQLPLEPGDEYDTFRAEVRDGSDVAVWSSGDVRATGRAGAQSITLDIEARLLPPGRYELTLTGERNRASEAVGYYYFRVQQR